MWLAKIALLCSATSTTVTIVEPQGGEPATSALLFLHGLGGSGAELRQLAQQLQPALPSTRFVLPSAPHRSITVNSGMQMPAWYDIKSLEAVYAQQDDVRGLKRSARRVRELLAEQLAQPGIRRVAVGGFSQGGAVALFAALVEPLDARVAAVVALSTYLPARDKLSRRVSDADVHRGGAAAVPPVLMCHGRADGTVQFAYGKASAKALKALGVRTTFRSYAGLAHSVGEGEVADVALFLQKRLHVPGDEIREEGEL